LSISIGNVFFSVGQKYQPQASDEENAWVQVKEEEAFKFHLRHTSRIDAKVFQSEYRMINDKVGSEMYGISSTLFLRFLCNMLWKMEKMVTERKMNVG
jgi:hypothetical protein